MSLRILYRLPLIATLVVLAACQQAETPATTAAEQTAQAPSRTAESWDGFVNRYIEDYLAAHPAWAVVQGRHEFDGRLPDWSASGIQREIARMHGEREAALAFSDADLSDEQRFQREYLLARVDQDLFWTEKARYPFRNPEFYLGWLSDSLDPAPYITLDYAPAEQRLAAFNRYLAAIPTAAAQIRANLEMPMPRTWLQLGVDAFGGLATYFRDDVPKVWASVQDAALQAEYRGANAAAVAAMQGLADWLESNRDTATEDFALGPDLFRQMLWDTERVDTPLNELEAIGRADMARNLQALRDACAEFDPAATIDACFGRMEARKPDVSPVEAAREQMQELRSFVEREDLVTIPGTEEARVAEAPPYARSNFAYINIPGPWEKNQPSVYYISPPNPAWPEDVQADYIAGESDLLFTSVHEVWPGHFLNFLHANRAKWLFGRAFVGYAFGEGWAHYTEEMMLEAGLRGADPETRIGELSNALLRDARFLSSIGLHTQGWSVEDSKRVFMDEAYQSEGTAIQQAARGTYDPAYLNYTMGKLLIRQLREDWTATRGGRRAWHEFHDRFLSFGGPPIPLVRQQMLGEPRPRAVFPQQPEPGGELPGTGARQLNWAWHCADGRFVVSSEKDGRLWLFLPGGTLPLDRSETASGERYEASGTVFWSKGEEATLEQGGQSTTCRLDREASIWEDAKLRGADFRAQGNEPGWYLELFSGRPSLLVTDYGQRRLSFDAAGPEPADGGSGSLYRGEADGVPVLVSLESGRCTDSMADREYPTRVSVTVGERRLSGCGQPLH